jgi:hypothetical protein
MIGSHIVIFIELEYKVTFSHIKSRLAYILVKILAICLITTSFNGRKILPLHLDVSNKYSWDGTTCSGVID